MENTTSKPYKLAYTIGLIVCALSFGIYLFFAKFEQSSDLFSASFFLNYFLSCGYMLYIFIYWLVNKPRVAIPRKCWSIVLVLFTISAFALNKSMAVYAKFPMWLNIATLNMIAVILSAPFTERFPKFLKGVFYLISGTALVLAVYMAIFISPLMPVSIPGLLFFGISIHTFVPGSWVWFLIHHLVKKSDHKKIKSIVWIGITLPIIFISIYLYKWQSLQTKVADLIAERHLQLNNRLPEDIFMAQKLPSDPLSEEILLAKLKSQRFFGENMFWFDTGNNEQKFHDPLAVLAIAFFDVPKLDQSTIETILNIRKDYRHKTTRKLWSGNSLQTTSVSSNIDVYPEYRLAYQEKTYVIHNEGDKTERFWFNWDTEEALYTFHLPEGSIVTSLSLWVNGVERKSRLSTDTKADSAYANIVGVQQRDPSVVHWQEGNRVTVNVFPCTTKEDRTFKIGFTTPLKYSGDELILENVWFEGPDFNDTREATRIRIAGKQTAFASLPAGFKVDAKGDVMYKGDYVPSWQVSMKTVPLANNKFIFGGNSYQLKKMKTEKKALNIERVYLDITSEWTREEYDMILNALTNKKIKTWLPEEVVINDNNKEQVWEAMKDNQYPMPFLNNIGAPEKSIVLTKSGASSPLLSEMKNSEYARLTTEYFKSDKKKIAVFNFGNELAPLWRSFHELRLIDYNNAPLENILGMISKNTYELPFEDSTTIALNESRLSLVKNEGDSIALGASAPDHLLRLFGYNDVLRKLGKHYFVKEEYEDELFREAEEAYVVTPVTSMIVLETDADYEKMGIKENTDTVGNAAVLGGGAVPEPHEWVLIGLFASLVLYYFGKKRKWKLIR